MHFSEFLINECYIDGAWHKTADHIAVYNPFNNELLGTVSHATTDNVLEAITKADEAFVTWKKVKTAERKSLLQKWYDLIVDHRKVLAELITLEQGKPLADALSEMDYGLSYLKYYIEEIDRVSGDILPSDHSNRQLLVYKNPVGVCAAITPWNFPSAMILRKCAPALAAGCTLVIKPSELTPFSGYALAKLAADAGFPPGVLNMVTGDPNEIGEVLTSHHLVKKGFIYRFNEGRKIINETGLR